MQSDLLSALEVKSDLEKQLSELMRKNGELETNAAKMNELKEEMDKFLFGDGGTTPADFVPPTV